MKIIHVSHCYFPAIAGIEVWMKEVSERLAKNGNQITVLTSNRINHKVPAPEEEEINKVRVKRLNDQWFYSYLCGLPSALAWLLKFPGNDFLRTLQNGPILANFFISVNEVKPKLIMASPFPAYSTLQAYYAAKKLKIPFVIFPAIHPSDEWGFDRQIFYEVLKKSNTVIANSEFEKKYLIEKGISENKIEVIGSGVDMSIYENHDNSNFRSKHGIKNTDLLIIYVGTKSPRKKLDILFEAMSKIWKDFENVYLLLAGHGSSYFNSLLKKYKQYQSKIISIDLFPDTMKSEIYNAGDFLVLPSQEESFGIVFLEAWACKKPVIGHRSGAIKTIIDENSDGLLFDDTDELSEKIRILIENSNLRAKLGIEGYKKVVAKYTWDIIARKVEILYETVLNK